MYSPAVSVDLNSANCQVCQKKTTYFSKLHSVKPDHKVCIQCADGFQARKMRQCPLCRVSIQWNQVVRVDSTNTLIDVAIAKALIRNIKNGDLSAKTQLAELLSRCQLQVMADVIKNQRSPNIIDLSNRLVSSADTALDLFSLVILKFPSYFDQLSELYLGNNQIGQRNSESFKSFCKVLGCLKQLRGLGLGNNQLSQVGHDCFKAFCVVLGDLTQLRALDIRNNQLGQLNPESFICFSNSLSKLKQLCKLISNDNNLGHARLESFSTALAGLPQLHKLVLYNNQFGKAKLECFEAFCLALSKLKQLKTLFLWNNQLGLKLELFSSVLGSLDQLQTLYLGDNQLAQASSESLKNFYLSLSCLKQLRELGLGNNGLNQKNIKKIISLDKKSVQIFLDFLCKTSQLIYATLDQSLKSDIELNNQCQQLFDANRKKLQTEAHQLGMIDVDLSSDERTYSFCRTHYEDPELGFITQLQKFDLLKEKQANQLVSEINMSEESSSLASHQLTISGLTLQDWHFLQERIRKIEQRAVPEEPQFNGDLVQTLQEGVDDYNERKAYHIQLQQQLGNIKKCPIKSELLIQLRTLLYNYLHYARAIASNASSSKEETMSNILGVMGMAVNVIPMVGPAASLTMEVVKEAYSYQAARKDASKQQALVINVPEELKISIVETLCREIVSALSTEDIISDSNIKQSHSFIQKISSVLYKQFEKVEHKLYKKGMDEILKDRKAKIKMIALNICHHLLKGLINHRYDLDNSFNRKILITELVQGVVNAYASSPSNHASTIIWYNDHSTSGSMVHSITPYPTVSTAKNIATKADIVELKKKLTDEAASKHAVNNIQDDVESLTKALEEIKSHYKADKADIVELKKKLTDEAASKHAVNNIQDDVESLTKALEEIKSHDKADKADVVELKKKLTDEAASKHTVNNIQDDVESLTKALEEIKSHDKADKADVVELKKKLTDMRKNTIDMRDALVSDGYGRQQLRAFKLDLVTHDKSRQALLGNLETTHMTLPQLFNYQLSIIDELTDKVNNALVDMQLNIERLQVEQERFSNKIEGLEIKKASFFEKLIIDFFSLINYFLNLFSRVYK